MKSDRYTLTENNIEYNRLNLHSLKLMNGYVTSDVEPVACNCSEVECQCVVKMISDTEARKKC